MATYFLEKRAQVLEADGESQSINDLDRMQVVMHMWEFEASFAAARQRAIDAYMHAYRCGAASRQQRPAFAWH